MERKDAIEIINSEIKGYRLQRTNTLYNNMSIGTLSETFRINMGNIALFPEPVLKIGAALALAVGAIYAQKSVNNPLTKKINKLKELKQEILDTDFVSDISEEELHEIARTKSYTK